MFPGALPAARGDAFRAWVSIAPGCDNACTFCIVPLVRGPQRSRSMGDILAEVQGLARQRRRGGDAAGSEREHVRPRRHRARLAASSAVRAAVAGGRVRSTGIRRVRFTSPHPHDFTPDVIEAMAETPAVCEHIHFPLQSGSDRVLKAMQRSYRRERYLGWLEAIRAAIPDVAVSTDVIVGFPGETEEDFAQTLEVVEHARVRQRVHVPVLAAARDARGVVRRAGRRRRSCRSASNGSRPCRSGSRCERRARRSAARSRCWWRARDKQGPRRRRRGRARTGSCTWRTPLEPGTFVRRPDHRRRRAPPQRRGRAGARRRRRLSRVPRDAARCWRSWGRRRRARPRRRSRSPSR